MPDTCLLLQRSQILRKVEELLGHQNLQLLSKQIIFHLANQNQRLLLVIALMVHQKSDLSLNFVVDGFVHLNHLFVELLLVELNFAIVDFIELLVFNLHLLDLEHLRPLLALGVKNAVNVALFIFCLVLDLHLDLLEFCEDPLLLRWVSRLLQLLPEPFLFFLELSQLVEGFLINLLINVGFGTAHFLLLLHLKPGFLNLDVLLLLFVELVHEASQFAAELLEELFFTVLDVLIDQSCAALIGIRLGLVLIDVLLNLVDVLLALLDLFVDILDFLLYRLLLAILEHLLQHRLLSRLFLVTHLLHHRHPATHFFEESFLFVRVSACPDSLEVLFSDVTQLLLALEIELLHLGLELGLALVLQLFRLDPVLVQLVSFLVQIIDLILEFLDFVGLLL